MLYAGWLAMLGLFNMIVVRLALRPALLASDHDATRARRIRIGAWLPILIGIGAAAASFAGPIWVLAVLVLCPLAWSLGVRFVSRG